MISAYIKLTNYCNIGCSHCYLPQTVRDNKSRMSLETIRKCADLTREYAGHNSTNKVHFIIHGGEPLTLGVDYLDNAISCIKAIEPRASFSLQTSLIPFTSKFSPLIHSHFDSSIGTSIDFNQRTINGSSNDYMDLFLNKASIARSDGISLIPGFVPSKGDLGRASYIIDFLSNNEFWLVNIDRYNNYSMHHDSDMPSNNEHSKILIELAQETFSRVSQGKPYVYFNVLDAAIKGVKYGLSGDRWGTSCQKNFLVFNPDGSINACPDRIDNEDPFSNVDEGVSKLVNSEKRNNWMKVNFFEHKGSHCLKCEFNHWCKSGCPITDNSDPESCSGYKPFLKFIQHWITNNPEVVNQYMENPYTHGEVQCTV